ncbi:MAG: flippase activity-associated protein Agl23, partial [Thermoanaerobaculales bacterium]
HGPLLFYVIAPLFAVLGGTTAVGRLYPALAGVALVALPLLLRRRLGCGAAWWTGLLVAISPNFLYYSRFIRSDVPVCLYTGAALAAYLLVRRRGWRAVPWIGVAAAAHATSIETFYVYAPLLGVAMCAVALYDALQRSVRLAWDWLKQCRLGVVARVLGFIGRTLGGVLKELWRSLGRMLRWVKLYWLALGTAVAWFVVITVLAYTVFFVHPEDWLFPLKAVKYWYHQHQIQRVGGPWHFHLIRLAAYEFLPLVAALVLALRRRSRLKRIELFCLSWGIAAVGLFAYLGEKTPWLIVHQVLPFFPLAGAQLARTFSPHGRWWSRGLAVVGLGATAWSALAANFLYPTISPNNPHAELLVFVQTTPEEEALAQRGIAIARNQEGVTDAAVAGEGTWPLSWQWKKLRIWWSLPEGGMQPTLVVSNPEDEATVRQRIGGVYRMERIPLRAWWVEDLSAITPASALRWFLTRRPWSPGGATDILVFEKPGS